MALLASPSAISTKAKPRERPVSRSVTRLMLSTAPCGSNKERIDASVALKSKLPTKIFFTLISLLFESGLFEAGRNRGPVLQDSQTGIVEQVSQSRKPGPQE